MSGAGDATLRLSGRNPDTLRDSLAHALIKGNTSHSKEVVPDKLDVLRALEELAIAEQENPPAYTDLNPFLTLNNLSFDYESIQAQQEKTAAPLAQTNKPLPPPPASSPVDILPSMFGDYETKGTPPIDSPNSVLPILKKIPNDGETIRVPSSRSRRNKPELAKTTVPTATPPSIIQTSHIENDSKTLDTPPRVSRISLEKKPVPLVVSAIPRNLKLSQAKRTLLRGESEASVSQTKPKHFPNKKLPPLPPTPMESTPISLSKEGNYLVPPNTTEKVSSIAVSQSVSSVSRKAKVIPSLSEPLQNMPSVPTNSLPPVPPKPSGQFFPSVPLSSPFTSTNKPNDRPSYVTTSKQMPNHRLQSLGSRYSSHTDVSSSSSYGNPTRNALTKSAQVFQPKVNLYAPDPTVVPERSLSSGSVHRNAPRTYQDGINMVEQNYRVPEDWELKHTSDGREYFRDHTTKSTHWAPPLGWAVAKTGEGKLYYLHDGTKTTHWKLPPRGWDVYRTGDGRIFFADNINKTTSWTMP